MKSGIDVLAERFGLLSADRQAVGLLNVSQPLRYAHRLGEDTVFQTAGSPLREVLVTQQSRK
jgi:hypothetical protein